MGQSGLTHTKLVEELKSRNYTLNQENAQLKKKIKEQEEHQSELLSELDNVGLQFHLW